MAQELKAKDMIFIDQNRIRPVRLTGAFHFLGVFASGDLRGDLGSKTAIAFEHGVV